MQCGAAARAVVAIAALSLGGAVPSTADAARPARTITYATQRLGAVQTDYARFRDVVAATLRDPRGWSLNGRVAFREVSGSSDLVVTLASPAAIAGFPTCSAYYSCRVGPRVLINAQRWRDATASYRGRALLRPIARW